MSHASFAHDALVYERDDDATGRILGQLARCVDAGGHALVCVPERLAERVSRELAFDATTVELRPVDDRYGRPIDAMRQLWDFTATHLSAGATHVLSIGELPVLEPDALAGWLWYEAAVGEVLGSLPIHATCLLDRRSFDGAGLAAMVDVHEPDHVVPPMPVVALPRRAPDLAIDTRSAASARALVDRAADGLDPDARAAAAVVVSELVTNAVKHADAAARVRIWRTAAALVLAVADDGPGLADPVAALRPPDLPRRGAGLWLSNNLADRFSVHNLARGGCEARARFPTTARQEPARSAGRARTSPRPSTTRTS